MSRGAAENAEEVQMRNVYIDDMGMRVYVSIFQDPDKGWQTRYGACRGHKRLKTPMLPLVDARSEAEQNLESYALAKGWQKLETPSS